MNLYEANGAKLSAALGVECPDEFVILAKHQILGLTNDQIADTLGCTLADIVAAEGDELYQRIKGYVGGINATEMADQSTGWDAIENAALAGLIKRLPVEKDTDTLLRIAAVANRATRRTRSTDNVLDPSKAGRQTITLTQRLVSKITAKGEQVIASEKTLSIHDGSMGQASFAEVDDLLSVRAMPALPQAAAIQVRGADDPSVNDLVKDMMKVHKHG